MLSTDMIHKLQLINGIRCRVLSPEILEVTIYSENASTLAITIMACYHCNFKETNTGFMVIPKEYISQIPRINKELDKRSHRR